MVEVHEPLSGRAELTGDVAEVLGGVLSAALPAADRADVELQVLRKVSLGELSVLSISLQLLSKRRVGATAARFTIHHEPSSDSARGFRML